MTEVPEVGQLYETQKSHVVGVVVEVVPNPSGTYRLRLVTPQLETRWTTFTPEVINCECCPSMYGSNTKTNLYCFECKSELKQDEFTLVCPKCD